MTNNNWAEGDLLEAVKGETIIRGRAVSRPAGLSLGEFTSMVSYYEGHGFTISLIEKAPPKVELPTEWGYYVDSSGDPWLLSDNGYWYDKGYSHGTSNRDMEHIASRAPFTRLESRADTAKAVLARLDELWDGPTTCREDFAQVAVEYGVEL